MKTNGSCKGAQAKTHESCEESRVKINGLSEQSRVNQQTNLSFEKFIVKNHVKIQESCEIYRSCEELYVKVSESVESRVK